MNLQRTICVVMNKSNEVAEQQIYMAQHASSRTRTPRADRQCWFSAADPATGDGPASTVLVKVRDDDVMPWCGLVQDFMLATVGRMVVVNKSSIRIIIPIVWE